MTMRPSGQEGVTIKGLAKLFNRGRHGLWAKYVDVSPFRCGKEATPQ
jgi:hypothetical protein